MVPYNVAFRRNDRKRDLIIFDMVIELFFIMDIVVHFRTSFVDISGRIIYDQKKIAIHYLKGWFILDFLAALPFEALYFVNHTWVSIYAIAIKFLYCMTLNLSLNRSKSHVHTAPEEPPSKNVAFYLRLALPSTLIRHENGALRKPGDFENAGFKY